MNKKGGGLLIVGIIFGVILLLVISGLVIWKVNNNSKIAEGVEIHNQWQDEFMKNQVKILKCSLDNCFQDGGGFDLSCHHGHCSSLLIYFESDGPNFEELNLTIKERDKVGAKVNEERYERDLALYSEARRAVNDETVSKQAIMDALDKFTEFYDVESINYDPEILAKIDLEVLDLQCDEEKIEFKIKLHESNVVIKEISFDFSIYEDDFKEVEDILSVGEGRAYSILRTSDRKLYGTQELRISSQVEKDEIIFQYALGTFNCEDVAPCIEDWTCEAWSQCVNGQQTRTCLDSNSCGTEIDKPIEEQTCDEEILNRDFGILKFLETITTEEVTQFMGPPYTPIDFGDDIQKLSLDVYSYTGTGDTIRIAVQTYETIKSYEVLKTHLFQEFENVQSVEVNEFEYNGKNYVCTIKSTEGVRCLWISNNILLFTLIELSQESIDSTPLLRESWEELLNYYLDSYPPTG